MKLEVKGNKFWILVAKTSTENKYYLFDNKAEAVKEMRNLMASGKYEDCELQEVAASAKKYEITSVNWKEIALLLMKGEKQ